MRHFALEKKKTKRYVVNPLLRPERGVCQVQHADAVLPAVEADRHLLRGVAGEAGLHGRQALDHHSLERRTEIER